MTSGVKPAEVTRRLRAWTVLHGSNAGGGAEDAVAAEPSAAETTPKAAEPKTTPSARTNKRRRVDLADRLWDKKARGFDWSQWRRENPKGRRRARNECQSYQSIWSNSEQPGILPPPEFDPTRAYHKTHRSEAGAFKDKPAGYRGGFISREMFSREDFPDTQYQTHCKRCGKTWDKPSQVAAHQRWCRPPANMPVGGFVDPREAGAAAAAAAAPPEGAKEKGRTGPPPNYVLPTGPRNADSRDPYYVLFARAPNENPTKESVLAVYSRNELRSILKNNRRSYHLEGNQTKTKQEMALDVVRLLRHGPLAAPGPGGVSPVR